MFGFNQQQQAADLCLICKQPCFNTKIPLEFDMSRGVVVHACSTQCQLFWQNLVQVVQQQQQHIPFQQQNQFNPSFYDQQRPPSHLQQPPTQHQQHPSFNNPMISHQSFQQTNQMQHYPFPNQNLQFNPVHSSHPNPQPYPNNQNKGPTKVENPPIDPRSKATSINPTPNPQTETFMNKPPSLPLTTPNNNPPVLSPPNSSNNTNPSINPTSPPTAINNNISSTENSSSVTSDGVKVVQYRTLYIVVDTNVLLEHLWFILNLRYLESVTVVVPIVAIHELDGLKKSEDESVASRSRNALKVIHEGLQENQSLVKKWLRGQSSHEMLASSDTMIMRNNDDQILNCALWFSRNVAGTEDGLILATNDTGLSLKAMMQGVDSKNVSQLSSCLPAKTEPGAPLSLILNNKSSAPIIQSVKTSVIPRESLPMKWEAKIWKLIFCNLPPRYLPKMTSVCYSFYQLVNGDDDVWRFSIQNAFDDKNGVLIPPEISPKQWYIKWRRQTLTIPSK